MRDFIPYSGIKFLFAFLCVTFFAYALSSYALFFLESRLASDKPRLPLHTAHVKPDLPATTPLSHYSGIWEKNIFHTAAGSQKEETEPVRVEELTVTSLNCSLIGTITEEKGDGWAVIRDNDDNRQEMVTLGFDFKGARVVRIFQDKVILNIDGKDELLLMDMEEQPTPPSPVRAAGTAARAQVLTYNISRNLIQDSLNNLASVMSGVRVEPYFEGGKPDGFRVSRIQPGNLLTSMGFQNGDIVKTVNGRPIATAEDAMRLYGAMKDSPFFRVGIIRNNRPATLQIRVR
jgi:general secretion pathway protein C